MFLIWMRLGFFFKDTTRKTFYFKGQDCAGGNVRKRELLWHCVAVQPVKSFRHSSSERLKIQGASTKSTKVRYLSKIIQTVRPGWQDKFSTRQRKAWHPLARGQSWPWPLTPWPIINRVPPLIIHNLHVKFESVWAKTVVAIVPTRSYT